MIVAGTGHRPTDLGGYGEQAFQRLVSIATAWLRDHNVRVVISGMALGWDQALAQAALNLNIPVHAFCPGTWQPSKWPSDSQDRYYDMLKDCTLILYTTQGSYNAAVMQERNIQMVDACDTLLAMYSGKGYGGTANCLRYAEKNGVTVVNLYDKLT